jgi:TetR/AcrR family transcriptional regulator, copper-responsive repressor
MARPRAFDEAEVLDHAADVFSRHGFDGTSIALLSEAMGLRPPSIYAAFGSKRGLFDAVLNRYTDRQSDHGAWVLAAPTAREVAERMLYRAAEMLTGPEQPPGCLLIQAGMSAAPENADVPVELARRRQTAELALRDRFEQAKAAGDLPAEADAAALASFVTAVFSGLSVQAGGGATSEELRRIVDQAMLSWDGRTTAPASAVSASAKRSIEALDAPSAGRGRPREFSASEALTAAMEVFWRKGYEGASLADLTEAMGITRPTLYATFGNKEALFFRALDRYQEENMAYVREALKASTVRGVVEAMLAGALAAQLSDETPPGCLSFVNSMQGGDEARVIRAEVLARSAAAHGALVERLERGQAEGEVPAPFEPEGLARLLSAVMQALATQSQAGASAEQLRALVDSALAVWPTK